MHRWKMPRPAQNLRRPENYESYPAAERRGGWEINKTVSITVILALVTWTVSGVWFAAQQSAGLQADHSAIAALQSDEKEAQKQSMEILLHVSSMDQTLKDILTYGMPRGSVVPTPQTGQTIINTAPISDGAEHR